MRTLSLQIDHRQVTGQISTIRGSRVRAVNSENARASWSAVTESAESPLWLATARLSRSTRPIPTSKAATALRSVGQSLLLTRIVESWFGFAAERRPRVAVGFSTRWRTQRVGVAERRLNGWQMRPLKRRSATRILTSGNRGLKPAATIIQSLRDTGRKRSV